MDNEAEFLRLQPRLSVDANMGEFYHWLRRLPPEVRARELLMVARLGWGMAIAHGRLSGMEITVPSSLPPAAGAPAPRSAVALRPAAESQDALMDEAVDQALGAFPLDALAGPPIH